MYVHVTYAQNSVIKCVQDSRIHYKTAADFRWNRRFYNFKPINKQNVVYFTVNTLTEAEIGRLDFTTSELIYLFT